MTDSRSLDSSSVDAAERISSTQAALLLGVHESSIKRWCNTGQLQCGLTTGGHRRIALDDLVAFGKNHTPAARLLSFDGMESRLWAALNRAMLTDSFDALASLAREWLSPGDVARLANLLLFLREMGLASTVIYDRVVAAVMHGVGEDWMNGRIETGDEHRMTQSMIDALRLQQTLSEYFVSDRGSNSEDGMRSNGARLHGNGGSVAIVGCSAGEQHELGALLVRLLLMEVGWRVVYLGQNVPPEDLAAQQRRHRATLVCVSIMPPRGRVEAAATARLLRTLYDSSCPYQLAIGGPNVGDHLLDADDSPQVQTFENLLDFAHWIAGPIIPQMTA